MRLSHFEAGISGGKRALMIGLFRETSVVVDRHLEDQRLTQYVGLDVSTEETRLHLVDHGRGSDRNPARSDLPLTSRRVDDDPYYS
jgi:hypothetical protein